ncbi:hypothetical protein [Micromonospora sp. KC606]|nr:hypothetical protein [Micromonospora sp. KC606]
MRFLAADGTVLAQEHRESGHLVDLDGFGGARPEKVAAIELTARYV